MLQSLLGIPPDKLAEDNQILTIQLRKYCTECPSSWGHNCIHQAKYSFLADTQDDKALCKAQSFEYKR